MIQTLPSSRVAPQFGAKLPTVSGLDMLRLANELQNTKVYDLKVASDTLKVNGGRIHCDVSFIAKDRQHKSRYFTFDNFYTPMAQSQQQLRKLGIPAFYFEKHAVGGSGSDAGNLRILQNKAGDALVQGTAVEFKTQTVRYNNTQSAMDNKAFCAIKTLMDSIAEQANALWTNAVLQKQQREEHAPSGIQF